jgi:soluble cytochrome b562
MNNLLQFPVKQQSEDNKVSSELEQKVEKLFEEYGFSDTMDAFISVLDKIDKSEE